MSSNCDDCNARTATTYFIVWLASEIALLSHFALIPFHLMSAVVTFVLLNNVRVIIHAS